VLTPSPLRHLAAWGLDFLLIAVLLIAVQPLLPVTGFSLVHALAAWVGFEMLAWRLAAASFGYYAMGVTWGDLRRRVLERDLLGRAHWLIFFIAAVQVGLAARALIEVLDPAGLFYVAGHRLAPPLGPALWFSLGVGGLLGAVGLFRCKRYGPPLVLLLQLFVVANDLTSQALLRDAAQAAMAGAGEGRSPTITSGGYLRTYLVCNLLYLVWMAALFAVMRRRFTFRGLF
jgi:hypothetical protein